MKKTRADMKGKGHHGVNLPVDVVEDLDKLKNSDRATYPAVIKFLLAEHYRTRGAAKGDSPPKSVLVPTKKDPGYKRRMEMARIDDTMTQAIRETRTRDITLICRHVQKKMNRPALPRAAMVEWLGKH
jgi:hypothetical protein